MEEKNFLKIKLTGFDRINLIFSLILRIFLAFAGVIAVIFNNWNNLFLVAFALFLTFLPNIIERRFKIIFPSYFQATIVFFIYASLYLGEIELFYDKFWWWDLFMHFFSSIITAIIGLAWFRILSKHKRFKVNPLLAVIFSFCFSLSIGVLWEIVEFSLDYIFSTNMQRSSLVDTMTDLILNFSGAVIVSIAGFVYLKKRQFEEKADA
ncbi:MAG: hypothetical protein PHE24_06935 [Patescibacteria group bacterium]|nr:hypothetical protein [Patescibacteria group bacterium]